MRLRPAPVALLLIAIPIATQAIAETQRRYQPSTAPYVETSEQKAKRLGNRDPLKASQYKTQKGKEEVTSVAPNGKNSPRCKGGKMVPMLVGGVTKLVCVRN